MADVVLERVEKDVYTGECSAVAHISDLNKMVFQAGTRKVRKIATA